jgi:serine phosphatase RsbU (regulator of sigma subunit)/anti-sigma regulatory factor (Ser/Thr protein kinase)
MREGQVTAVPGPETTRAYQPIAYEFTMPQQKVAHREFPAASESVGAAREFVRTLLCDWGWTEHSEDVVLLVSELVTNAVMHARTTVEVGVREVEGGTEVAVFDRLPTLQVPQAGPLQVDTSPSTDGRRSGGLGLGLVAAVSSSWGVTYTHEHKAVWFRLAAESAPHAPALSRQPLAADGQAATHRRSDPWAPLDAALNERLSLDDLLDRTVDTAREVLDGDAAYITLATTDETQWEVRAVSGLGPAPWHPFTSRTEETFPSAAPEPGPVINDDVMLARAHRGLLTRLGMRSLVTAPLIVEGRITGLIGVASRRTERFTRSAATTLQQGADRIALPVERARLAQVELARRASLSFLAEASDMLAGTLDERRTAALAAQLATSRLGAWCAVFTAGDNAAVTLLYATHRDEESIEALHRLLRASPPQEQSHPQRLWSNSEIIDAGLAAEQVREAVTGPAVSLPLFARGRRLGLLVVGQHHGMEFGQGDVDVAQDLARRVSSALENARLFSDQTSMSEALQRSLLPVQQPEIPGVDYAVHYQPAGKKTVVGGDFYDVFLTEGRWCFAVGDVCGTGPEAASVTGLARHTLRALAREGFSPAHIMHRLNLAILDENPSTRFLTMLYGELTPARAPEEGMRLRMVSAGHPLPLRLRPSGEVETVGSSQPLLGAFEDVEFFSETVDIAPKDVLLAVTDGVTERRNGDDMLGEEGLIKILGTCSGLTAQAVITRIDRELDAFAPGEHNDDTAMMVLRFL